MCSDRSDQVFWKGLTCGLHLKLYMEFHDRYFCNSSEQYDVQTKLICTDKEAWIFERSAYIAEVLLDPHNCKMSCSSFNSSSVWPNIDWFNCIACSNQDYFNCFKSGKCVHPDLECDGHPQCPNGEDENLAICHEKYIEDKIVSLYASYRCKSIFYENMWIYATPCDKIVECYDHSDENFCDQDKKTRYILFGSAFAIFFLYDWKMWVFKWI